MGGRFFQLTSEPDMRLVAKHFNDAADRLSDFTDYFDGLHQVFQRGTQGVLDSQGSVIGSQWPEPNPAYVASKLAAGFGDIPMYRTGAIENFLSSEDAILHEDKHSISYGLSGSRFPHAQALFFGRDGQGRGYEYLGWSDQMKDGAQTLYATHLNNVVRDLSKGIDNG